jgi:formylglycine-generating enzyme required for sulfatase activity
MNAVKQFFLIAGVVLGFGWAGALFANNLQISNLALNGRLLSFNVSWDNSWRTMGTAPYNYDAVWLFVKYRDCSTLQWNHANVDSAGAASPLFADTTSDQKGVMVYRSADGGGNISNVSVTFRLTGLPAGNFDFNVFGVEMVYVPQDSFYLGDGNSTYTWRVGTNQAVPYYINSEAPITLATTSPSLSAGGAFVSGTMPAEYPKGYRAFYCMKYEISQAQYAEFLNTLTSTQDAPRYFVSAANRYSIGGAWPAHTAAAGNRAWNSAGWDDLLTYLDWAALRPMTELEFEKACRGPAMFVPGEYAWGTTLVVDANAVVNDGTDAEAVTDAIPAGTGIANYGNSLILGPLRCGFAGTGTTNRLQIGATYYGICEMSGNVQEYCVSGGSVAGRTFVPNNGDGSISPVGLWDVPGWVTFTGNAIRGGAWSVAAAELRISYRLFATYATNSRGAGNGGRGVRF